MACKESPALLFSAADREGRTAAWQEAYPNSVERTLREAKQIRSLKFELMGTTYDLREGDRAHPDWHLDVASGCHWPTDYVERIDRWMWSDRKPGDYRPLWELNRHQYFVILGKAYWLTGDESYAETCAEHLVSWTRDNPCPFGVNWYSPLEIGLRLVAWGLAWNTCAIRRAFAPSPGRCLWQALTSKRAICVST